MFVNLAPAPALLQADTPGELAVCLNCCCCYTTTHRFATQARVSSATAAAPPAAAAEGSLQLVLHIHKHSTAHAISTTHKHMRRALRSC
jgi:hypothetical protein